MATFETITAAAIGGGGSSYLVYLTRINQSGTNAPTATVYDNSLGVTPSWARSGAGTYEGTFTAGATDRIYIPYASGATSAGTFIPVSDYASIVGYFRITSQNIAGNCTIFLEFIDNTFAYVDMSTLFASGGASTIDLPPIYLFAV